MNASTVARGFAEPVDGAQRVFRALLDANARPGRLQSLPGDVLAGFEPAGFAHATAATLLTLLDPEATLWLDPEMGDDDRRAYLRFHTGVRVVDRPADADFAVTRAYRADAALLATLRRGTDEMPQSGATLVVEVPRLAAAPPGAGLQLTGPGIRDVHRLAVDGLPPAFWPARAALVSDFPRGIELVFTCGDTLAALPRTTRVAMEA